MALPKNGDIPLDQGKQILRDFIRKTKGVDVGMVQLRNQKDVELFEKAMTAILPLYNL